MNKLLRPLIPGLAALVLAGCETARSIVGAPVGPPAGEQGFVRGFLGGVAAEEPSAAAVARAVLSAGGTAADAAAAAGFALTVTLPSRAGLGGGGACLVYHPRRDAPEALVFMPGARDGGLANADRPAAVPLMARGLFALTTRMQGARPFEEIIIPAERLARFGVPMSRALAADLAAVGGPLLADPNVRAVFTRADGSPVPVGESYTSGALAGTLTSLRSLGVGDLYQGALARRLVEAVPLAGGGAMNLAELRAALPAIRPAIIEVANGGDRVGFLPMDGGLAAAAAFRALRAGQPDADAQARGLSVGLAARSGAGADAAALLAQADLPAGSLGALPASTALTVFDREGGAVSCVFTMNNLFGTGRHAPGTGVLLAAAPNTGSVQPPLPAAAIAYNPNLRAFRMAVAGSGQQAAPMAVAGPLAASLIRGVGPGDAATAVVAPGADAAWRLPAIPARPPWGVPGGERSARLRRGAGRCGMKVGRGALAPPFLVMDVITAANARAAALPPGAPAILRMEVGQPAAGAPAGAVAAAMAALGARAPMGYTEAFGLPSLRARIARHYTEHYGLTVDAGRIAVTVGASGAFPLAFLAAFDRGDRVAMAAPFYPPYANILTALGMEPVLLDCGPESRFQPTISMLDALDPCPEGLVVASPCNPAGTMLTPAELAAIAAWCEARGVRLISDEIYHGLSWGSVAESSAAAFSASAVVVNSFSKYWSMTGWRVGWLLLPEDLVRPVECLAQNMFISAPHIAQLVAEAAMDCRPELEAIKARYATSRSVLLDGLPGAGFHDIAAADGAFYLWCDVSRLTNDSVAFAAAMLAGAGIAATPGIDFDRGRGGRYLRFSYCGPVEDMSQAPARLKAWLG